MPQPVWQEGVGSLLLLAAAQQTGLLEMLVKAVMGLADLTLAGRRPTSAVVDRLLRTLLFLPVAGLARTWDLRSYTGTMLALLSGRPYAYSQGYTEQFLARLARTKAAECLTETIARWTWSLWQKEQTPPAQTSTPAVFYVDGHRKPVYSAVLVPRGPVGRLDGKILGCRELVLLHDARGHPLLATTHRGDQHLTMGLPLCWLHGLSARQIESFPLQLSGILTTKYTLSQAREEHPCFLEPQLIDDEAHLSWVCFLQDNRQTTACWFSTQPQACKTFLSCCACLRPSHLHL